MAGRVRNARSAAGAAGDPRTGRYGAPVASEKAIRADTVAALLDAVGDYLSAEDVREQSFNTRAGGLSGFVGIIISLSAAVGKVALDENPSDWATAAGGAAFGVAMAALVVCLVIAITKVLVPQEGAAIAISDIEKYPTWDYISREKHMAEGEILRGLAIALAKDRQRNSAKARALGHAYIALLVGIGTLALFGAILAVDAICNCRYHPAARARGSRSRQPTPSRSRPTRRSRARRPSR